MLKPHFGPLAIEFCAKSTRNFLQCQESQW